MSITHNDDREISIQEGDGRFSLRQAKGLVKTFNRPVAWIYWTDFLVSIITGHVLFNALLFSDRWLAGSTAFTLTVKASLYCAVVPLFLRSVMFTHELVHLPKDGFRGFRIVWNLLCGIPFMIPSFMYYPHVDHHRRKSYGTEEDGEYLNLSHQPPRAIVIYMLLTLITPFAGFLRFAVIAPIGWVFPRIRNVMFHRASSMVMDIMYFRPDAGKAVRRMMFMQELACFGVCMFIALRNPLQGKFFDPLWVQAYFVSLGLLIMNNIRTLGAHRWTGDGSELSFQEQLLDSCDYPHRPWFTELWGPIGTRYHATHHLFPSIPYHNLGKAHRALMAGLPADSPLRETVKVSLLGELAVLWSRASAVAAREKANKSAHRNSDKTNEGKKPTRRDVA
ncbi:MAG: fatty acid desaturase [Pirellulaceae bacterium]|nr:fatty acid desaturase [Pirellulaceae bacterium]